MKKVSERKIMKALYKQYDGDYVQVLKWLKGSKTFGDGTYSYEFKKTCPRCNK